MAIPAYTGDVSLFVPENSHDARALDDTATITNLRTQCDETGTPVRSNVTFDVVATRANASGAQRRHMAAQRQRAKQHGVVNPIPPAPPGTKVPSRLRFL